MAEFMAAWMLIVLALSLARVPESAKNKEG